MTTAVQYQPAPTVHQFPAQDSFPIYPMQRTINIQSRNHQTMPHSHQTHLSQPTMPAHAKSYQKDSLSPAPFIGSRRTGSTSTIETNTTSTNSLRRMETNNSMGSNSIYVMTLRKQKATVWCDRSQKEDARVLAAQRAAKLRATMEVAHATQSNHHGNGLNSGSSSVYRAKMKQHHGMTGGMKRVWNGSGSTADSEFNINKNLVAGIPARLDIEDDSSEEDQIGSANGSVHGISRRTGSGRSSISSNGVRRYTPVHSQVHLHSHQVGTNKTITNSSSSPSSYSRTSSIMESSVPEGPETPESAIPNLRSSEATPRQEYFPPSHPTTSSHNRINTHSRHHVAHVSPPAPLPTFDSSSSGESLQSSVMNARKAALSKGGEEVSRRGSVDEMNARTMTMSGIRLFVANPDE